MTNKEQREALRGLHLCVPFGGGEECFHKLGGHQGMVCLEIGTCAMCGKKALGVFAHLAARPDRVLEALGLDRKG